MVPGASPACLPPAPGTQDTSPLSTKAHVLFWLGKWAPGSPSDRSLLTLKPSFVSLHSPTGHEHQSAMNSKGSPGLREMGIGKQPPFDGVTVCPLSWARSPPLLAISPCLVKAHGAPRGRALNLTASSEPPDPHPAGQCPPGSPRALLTRAGSHTAELSLQLGTLAGLAAVLGGHAGPHPAPGPPPAAAGAQAPGPPLLPHAVHCKEARGRWLGRTLAPPTAHLPTNQELQQFCDHSSLALPWTPRSPLCVGMWMTGVSIPRSHRIPPVDTWTRSLGSTQKGSQGPLLEAQESPGRT